MALLHTLLKNLGVLASLVSKSLMFNDLFDEVVHIRVWEFKKTDCD